MTPEGRRALAVGLVVGVLGGLWLGAQSDELGDLGGLVGGAQPPGEEAAEVIEDGYFKDVDASRLENASVRGMVRELRERYDDRFSHYFDPGQLKQFEQATSGKFSGIGLKK